MLILDSREHEAGAQGFAAVVAFEDLRVHLLGRSNLGIRICYLNNVVRASRKPTGFRVILKTAVLRTLSLSVLECHSLYVVVCT